MSKHGRRYTAKFKFQVILELLKGSKTTVQIARAYGVHPITTLRGAAILAMEIFFFFVKMKFLDSWV